MRSNQTGSTNGRARSSADQHDAVDVEGLQSTCRRQATELNALGHAVSALRVGAKALKAENIELRAANERLSRQRGLASRTEDRPDVGELLNLRIPLGAQAPGVARSVVARGLAEQVAPSVLEITLLLVSELVTNSVRHSGVPEGEDIVVRVHVGRDMCHLEVEDPGRDGIIATQPPDSHRGPGMGLNLVALLSERWGVVRGVQGPTRVWAQVPRVVPA